MQFSPLFHKRSALVRWLFLSLLFCRITASAATTASVEFSSDEALQRIVSGEGEVWHLEKSPSGQSLALPEGRPRLNALTGAIEGILVSFRDHTVIEMKADFWTGELPHDAESLKGSIIFNLGAVSSIEQLRARGEANGSRLVVGVRYWPDEAGSFRIWSTNSDGTSSNHGASFNLEPRQKYRLQFILSTDNHSEWRVMGELLAVDPDGGEAIVTQFERRPTAVVSSYTDLGQAPQSTVILQAGQPQRGFAGVESLTIRIVE